MTNHNDLGTGLSKVCRIVTSVRLSEYHRAIIAAHKVNVSALVRAELERIHSESKAVRHD